MTYTGWYREQESWMSEINNWEKTQYIHESSVLFVDLEEMDQSDSSQKGGYKVEDIINA